MDYPDYEPAGQDFTDLEPPAPKPAALWWIDEEWLEADIPLRPWVVKGFVMRGSLTVVSGPGSAGKSSLMVAWCVALALGEEFGRFTPSEPSKVLFYNVEDDKSEQQRRCSATLRQFGATPRAVMANLRMVGPHNVGTLLNTSYDGRILVNTPAMDELEDYIDKWQPDVVILDPFVELHSSEENDNTEIRKVLARFRSWAQQKNLGLVILHHARKGGSSPGDPDSMRGASAIVGAARVALTVNTMTEDEAKELGVSSDNRRDYFRLDGAKMNYAKVHEADWFERTEYTLDNGEGVAAAIPWKPPHQSVGPTHVAQLISFVSRGTLLGPYSPKLSNDPRSIKQAMEHIGISLPSAQKELLRQLLDDSEISTKMFVCPTTRNKRSGLCTSQGPDAKWVESDA